MAPEKIATVSDARTFAGSVPARLAKANFRVNVLRTNALLRHEEWLEIDRGVIEVARQRLNGIADLRQYGLVHPLGGLGTILSAYTQQGDMEDAVLDMSGVTPSENDRTDFDEISVPVPIVHKDFQLNIRHLEASRRMGDALDTTQSRVATRKVTDKLESLLFLGTTVKVNANPIYGYTTHPQRNTVVAAGDFGTISHIWPTINAMVAAAEADHYYGPYGLYVAGPQYAEMRAIYSDGSGQSAMQRLLDSIPQLRFIKPADVLPSGSLVLVTLSSECVDLALAQDIVPLEWETMGGLVQNFKVMSAMVPRVKADADGHSGIVHATGA